MMDLVLEVTELLRQKNIKLATAESCTGGMLSSLITEIPGSSDVFDRGFITYSNQAKQDMLGVSFKTLKKYGAVSAETASEMALGAIQNSGADITVSITGIAGPDGGTEEKPVGTVHIATAYQDDANSVHHQFKGNRSDIRSQSCEAALKQLIKALNS